MNPSIRVEGYWIVSGTQFSPGAAERATNVFFSQKTEPGELCAHGRYRGRPAPAGWGKCDFSVPPDDADLITANSEVLAMLERCVPEYRTAGAQEIVIHFNVAYANQCNLQLTAPLIHRLAALGVDVTLTCFAAP